jgi:hypothetical protein
MISLYQAPSLTGTAAMPGVATEFLNEPYAMALIALCLCLFAAFCCVLAFRLKVIRWRGGEVWFTSQIDTTPTTAKRRDPSAEDVVGSNCVSHTLRPATLRKSR